MLLSFNPYWYKKIRTGEKIFEYRTNFPNEEILAYMYVSSPVKQIVGIIHLGKRINLEDWEEQYIDNQEVIARIKHYMIKRKYVMPILSYQHTKGINLDELRSEFPNFVCPQMYYYLDTRIELLEYLQSHLILEDDKIINSFEKVNDDDICRMKYREECEDV